MDKGSEGFKTAAATSVPGHAVFDYLIVGAGFAGSVLAERLASAAGQARADRRQAAAHRRQRLRPLRRCRRARSIRTGRTSSTPTRPRSSTTCRSSPSGGRTSTACWPASTGSWCRSRSTSTRSTGSTDCNLTSVEMEELLRQSVAEKKERVRTSEDVVVSKVGRDLYNKFFRGYTRKQWGLDPSELDASVTARVPTRTNRDDRYFTDTYQAMPLHGYTRMFEHMLRHPNIKVMLNTDYREVVGPAPVAAHDLHRADRRVLRLPLRQAALPQPRVPPRQPAAAAVPGRRNGELSERLRLHAHHRVQAPHRAAARDDVDRLRIPARRRRPLLPGAAAGERRALPPLRSRWPNAPRDVHFVGRLATYKYYNMDQVVGQALAAFKRLRQRGEVHNGSAGRVSGLAVSA